jgi:hypothetical protein
MSRLRNEGIAWVPRESQSIRRESAKSPRQLATKSVALSPFDSISKSALPQKDDFGPEPSRRRMSPSTHTGAAHPIKHDFAPKNFHPFVKPPDGIIPQATPVQRIFVGSFAAAAFAVSWPEPVSPHGPFAMTAPAPRPTPDAYAGAHAAGAGAGCPRPNSSAAGDVRGIPRYACRPTYCTEGPYLSRSESYSTHPDKAHLARTKGDVSIRDTSTFPAPCWSISSCGDFRRTRAAKCPPRTTR